MLGHHVFNRINLHYAKEVGTAIPQLKEVHAHTQTLPLILATHLATAQLDESSKETQHGAIFTSTQQGH